MLPALHPHMATVYREKVERLAAALAHEDEDQREAARSALRGFIDQIVIPAGDGLLEVRGDLGRMLATAAGERDGSILTAVVEFWLRGGDLNPRPLGYEPNELPDCSTPRHGRNSEPRNTGPWQARGTEEDSPM